jgi:ATP-dependent Clp protease ATP-binding subunit ClpA
MFERFTDGARRTVVLAQEEARAHNHDYIDTEHLLLGVLDAGENMAVQVLESLGISREAIRQKAEKAISQGPHKPSGHISFTPQAKKVLELSLREALSLGHSHIGTEHILLALISEGQGVAAQVLVKLGLDSGKVRRQIVRVQPPVPVGKFTEHARKALALAEEEANAPDHHYIGTEHILLGLLGEGEGVAAKALAALGITLEAVRQQIGEIIIQGQKPQPPPADTAARINPSRASSHLRYSSSGLRAGREPAGEPGADDDRDEGDRDGERER